MRESGRWAATISRSAPALASALFVLLMASLAGAAGAEEHHATHASQADVLRETGWQAVNLVLVLALLVYFARKPIADYFSSRRSGIQTQLTQAAELLAAAEHRNSDLQRKLVDLNAELDTIRETAGRRAEEEAMRIVAEARATAERIRRDAQAAVDQELRRAQAKLRDEAAELALELAARKLESGVNEGDRERLVDEFITRIETSSAGGAPR